MCTYTPVALGQQNTHKKIEIRCTICTLHDIPHLKTSYFIQWGLLDPMIMQHNKVIMNNTQLGGNPL